MGFAMLFIGEKCTLFDDVTIFATTFDDGQPTTIESIYFETG